MLFRVRGVEKTKLSPKVDRRVYLCSVNFGSAAGQTSEEAVELVDRGRAETFKRNFCRSKSMTDAEAVEHVEVVAKR